MGMSANRVSICSRCKAENESDVVDIGRDDCLVAVSYDDEVVVVPCIDEATRNADADDTVSSEATRMRTETSIVLLVEHTIIFLFPRATS